MKQQVITEASTETTIKSLNMHCECKQTDLSNALQSMKRLTQDERKAVLKSLESGSDLPVRKAMANYRSNLAEAIGAPQSEVRS